MAPWDRKIQKTIVVARTGALEFDTLSLDRETVKKLWQAVSVPNPAYAEAVKRGGHRPPERVSFLDMGPYQGILNAPLYAFPLIERALRERCITMNVVDHSCTAPSVLFPTPLFTPSPVQEQAIEAACSVRGGVVVAPPGAGKTVMGMLAAARRGTPTLWVTHTSELARQAVLRAEQVLGLSGTQIGIFGGGKKKVGTHLTVAYIQTLAKADRETLAMLSRTHGLIVCDEAHHAPAMTWAKVMSGLACYARLGLTATNFRRDGMDAVIGWLCGPEIAKIGKAELGDRLVTPRIELRNTQCHEDAGDWTELVSKIVTNWHRTQRIARLAGIQHAEGKRVLILSSRVDHAQALQTALGPAFGLLVGEMSAAERKPVVAALADGSLRSCVATTSLVGEGFDVPGFEVLHLATPVSYHGSLEQYVGRVCRATPGKTGALVIDWVDGHAMLRASAKKRLALYRARGWRVSNGG